MMLIYCLLILIAISFTIPQAFGDVEEILYTEDGSEPPILSIIKTTQDTPVN